MEALKDRYTQLMQSYSRLQYMVKKFEKLLAPEAARVPLSTNISVDLEQENEFVLHRDALIKRFEFCYELTWKFFQLMLREKYSIEANSPRKVFQESFQQSIFSRDEAAMLLEMVDARNATTHKYDESAADAISQKIIDYCKVFMSVAQRSKVE